MSERREKRGGRCACGVGGVEVKVGLGVGVKG